MGCGLVGLSLLHKSCSSKEITLCVSMWMTCHVLQDVTVKSLDALG